MPKTSAVEARPPHPPRILTDQPGGEHVGVHAAAHRGWYRGEQGQPRDRLGGPNRPAVRKQMVKGVTGLRTVDIRASAGNKLAFVSAL